MQIEICPCCGKPKRPTGQTTIYADGKTRPAQWSADGSHEGWKRPSHENYSGNRVTPGTATPLAAAWAGHRYGLQALKPCAEFILVAQKPYDGRPVDCITSTGAGALNIDQSRVATGESTVRPLGSNAYQRRNSGMLNLVVDRELSSDYGGSTNGRWPPNCVLSHVAPRPDGHGGWLPGCERLGVKRVRGTGTAYGQNASKGQVYGNGKGLISQSKGDELRTYTDPDGTEPQQAWACVLGCACGHEWTAEQRGPCPECGGEARWLCAVGELGDNATVVAQNVFLQYNVGKQEVQPCCENASIAVVNLMLDHLMSSEDLADSVNENADMPASEIVGSVMPGDGKTSEPRSVAVGIGAGESQETAASINSLNTDGSGKWNMDQSQTDMMSTILMETVKITTCPICDSYLHLGITIYTNGDGKITDLSQMEQKQDVVNDVKSISHYVSSILVRKGPMVAIVKIVPRNTCESGTRNTQAIEPNIIVSGGHDKSQNNNVSRFFPQFSWSYEVAERSFDYAQDRLAQVPPYRYVSKASRAERDAGLEGFEARKEGAAVEGFKDGSLHKINITRKDNGPSDRQPQCNHHPCVKPLELLIYLARLISPPPAYAPRRLLVPFAGSGSEICGALLSQNWEHIVGIEKESEYVEISEARCRFWAGWAERGYTDPKDILKAAKREERQSEKAQMEMGL